MSQSQRVWLVTGCSSGIGARFVRCILARGDQIIATARDLQSITHFQRMGAAVLRLDVTDCQDAINRTIDQAIRIFGRIDVLVNNASYIQIGTWEDLEYSDLLAQFETNVFGTLKVTRAVMPRFRDQGSGTTVFIGSLSGWVGHRGCGAYAGSKFALEGMIESLHAETAELGVEILLIDPGRFRTKLLSAEKMKVKHCTIPEYRDASEKQLADLKDESENQPGDPEKLVNVVLDLVRREGVAEGKTVPWRLPLGKDCYEEILDKLENTKAVLEEWKDVVTSTDFSE